MSKLLYMKNNYNFINNRGIFLYNTIHILINLNKTAKGVKLCLKKEVCRWEQSYDVLFL